MPEIPMIAPGYKRQWLRCRTCRRLQYYDYLPYSLGNPIMTTACGHGVGEPDLGCDRISVDEATVEMLTHGAEHAPS